MSQAVATPTFATGPVGAPAWFRYGVIAAAALLMCSCRSAVPPGDQAKIARQSPSPSFPSDDVTYSSDGKVAPAQYAPPAELPSHLTPDQLVAARCLPPGCTWQPCAGGCSCCGPSCSIRGPDDEYLCDGGDHGLPAGVRADWRVTGLEQEDTIAHYDTVDGRTVVTPSNKVCIYAPRFGVVRRVVDPVGYNQAIMVEAVDENAAVARVDERERVAARTARLEPTIDRMRMPPSLLRERQQPGELDRDQRVAAALGSLAPYANLSIITTGKIVGRDVVEIGRSSLAAVSWSGDQAVQVLLDADRAQAEVSVQEPGVIYRLDEPNHPKLRLVKLASRGSAQQGELVEFTLRYDNLGDRVIGNVTIVDNLTTRLEYVEGSQKSTAKADFSTSRNEAGSLILRWEIDEPLQPGDGGVLQFKVRVR
ncbi:MAG: hypothetical protein KF688_00620 [Pirellulales bacterium]|nr:hypothetical protein [Pirellulales bacterium]